MITAAEAHRLFKYDPQTGIIVSRVTRGNAKAGSRISYVNGHGYLEVVIGYKKVRAHRLAWLLMTGSWPVDQVDHINGDRADNRWANLRRASHSENVRNKKVAGYRTRPGRNSYQVRLKVAGKEVLCCSFKSEEEAQELADFAREIVFEEFRRA